MRSAPTLCPICQSELEVVRLHCPSCDTSLEGHFAMGQFSNLSPQQMEFVFTFVRCEGKINRMEQELGLSYPTIRNRLHEVIRALGYEPGKDEPIEIGADKRSEILADLDAGKISAEDAMRILRGEEE
ncbi:MAG: hypothetical protein DCC56_10670 [Anaerolineae bacterium]|nr:hypothetical protein [Anaerolineales bacterium]RIK30765.1 MAG: hypothetical protein DCC56_10670 [Anaerolineae bacterium]WKZ44950.1 MAG: DUF2089 domain-containing protein [Anaerolineales bacterium]WKZ47561.1 MAG: DUF2089 domain-containing protein [Anaerolineales bacterium]